MKCISKLTNLTKRQYSDIVRNTKKVINIENTPQNLLQLQYEERSPKEIIIERKAYTKLIKSNISDSHSVGQAPITFVRQVLACVVYPKLMDIFPKDVKERAINILEDCGGNSIGSYSADIGMDRIRKSVAAYIAERDGFQANFEDIILSGGVTTSIYSCLQLLINEIDGQSSGIMVPVPNYNLYPAILSILGLKKVDYSLDGDKKWSITLEELEKSYLEGSKYSKVRAIVVINPNDPTGHILSRENIEMIIKFAYKKSLVIFADEVYQENVYKGVFCSFKKVLKMLGAPYDGMELVSFISISKGYIGESGIRGGWVELYNMDSEVRSQLNKCISAKLCPSTLGQTVVECLVNPPKADEPSYELYVMERSRVMNLYSDGVEVVEQLFMRIGFYCCSVQGAIFAYPRFKLTPKMIEAAKKSGLKPDVFYTYRLLEETGVCVVPGSKLGHCCSEYCYLRVTVLPNRELMKEMVYLFEKFHVKFVKEYS